MPSFRGTRPVAWGLSARTGSPVTLGTDSQPVVLPMPIGGLCSLTPSLYEQLGVELVEAECDLEINGLDAAKWSEYESTFLTSAESFKGRLTRTSPTGLP